MLEIGIGCDMPQGVGASIPLWRQYFDCGRLIEFEFNRACALGFNASLDGLVVGDQSNVADLARALALGPFHVIIDDGGHTVKQQLASIVHLFPSLPPGGLYFMEDT